MDKSNFIDFMELKMMMEKLGEPQTHLALKEMIRTVDEDKDDKISFREVGKFYSGTSKINGHIGISHFIHNRAVHSLKIELASLATFQSEELDLSYEGLNLYTPFCGQWN